MYIVGGYLASVSDMAGCRKRLAGGCEGGSPHEHEFKCVMVHITAVSLSPMKDNSSGSVRYFDSHQTERKASCSVMGFTILGALRLEAQELHNHFLLFWCAEFPPSINTNDNLNWLRR